MGRGSGVIKVARQRYERETSDRPDAGAAGDLDGSRRGGVQSTEVVEKTFIAEHGGQRSQASML